MSAYSLLPKGMKCFEGVQQGTYQGHFKRRPCVMCHKTCLGSWGTFKGNSLEIVFHGMGPQHSFSFLASLPNGCERSPESCHVEQRARPTPSPLFLGPVVRGQLYRQLSRHCSLPGKYNAKDVPGQAWEWVRVRVKMGVQVCLCMEASRGFEIL